MSKLGDLFIHLGVKKDNLTKGLDSAKKEVNGFGQTLGKMKAGAVALWATVGAVALKAADNFAHTSQRFGDLWDNTTAKMKGAWDEFIRSLNSWNWEGFGKRIKDAMDLAGDVQKSDDLAAEVRRSIQLKKDEQQGILNQDLITMRNMKLSYKEREAAAKDYLRRMKEIYDQEYLYRKDNADKKVKEYLVNNGLEYNETNVQALKKFIMQIAPNETLMKSYQAAARGGSNDPLAKLAVAYSNQSNDAAIEKVTSALHLQKLAQNGLETEQQRVISTMNSLGAKMEEHGKAVEEDVSKELEFVRAYELVNEQLEKGADLLAGNKFAGSDMTGGGGLLGGVGIDQEAIDARVDAFMRYQAAAEDLAYSLEDGLISALDELANAFAGVSGADFGSVIKALLTPLADAAVRAGLLVMTTGKALETLKEGFVNLFGGGPHAAIVAGAALMGLGVAAKAGLAAIGSGSSATGVATSGATAANTTTQTAYEDMNINVRIEGKLKGSDIVLAARGAEASWAR